MHSTLNRDELAHLTLSAVTGIEAGGGIGPEIIRNIFNPFFSTFAKGKGLGLSPSHRIIAYHHGKIKVINGELGARFIIILPVVQMGGLEPGRNEKGADG